MELSQYKDIAIMAAPLIKVVLETWLQPKLQDLAKTVGLAGAVVEHDLLGSFNDYLGRAYERQAYIRTVVFQNRQKLLKDLYIPLTVRRVGDSEEITLNSYRQEFLPAHRRVLVTDTAGMGKSTLMRFLFLQSIESNVGVPLFVDLRNLNQSKPLLSYIATELGGIREAPREDFIFHLLERGDFVHFLDGYDEIPLQSRDAVTLDLQGFIAKANNNQFIITSRPESALATFADFQKFTIRPLHPNESYQLIKLYDETGEVAAPLIAKLKERPKDAVCEFLTNPLLVSLLYKSYSYKPTVPVKKHTFYRQVYDAIFETHDLTKPGAYVREKYSQLDVEDFYIVLRTLGILTLTHGETELTRDTLLRLIAAAKAQLPGMEFKEGSFLADLRKTVPLFVHDGEYYRWSHKSFQDYFAACYICYDAKTRQADMLNRMYARLGEGLYYNVIDLCYDIDYRAFRKTILMRCLQSLEQAIQKPISEELLKVVSKDEVLRRRQVLFNGRVLLWNRAGLEHMNALENPSRLAMQAAAGLGLPRKRIHRLHFYFGKSLVASSISSSGWLATILGDKKDPLVRAYTATTNLKPQDLALGPDPIVVDEEPSAAYNKPEYFAGVTDVLAMGLGDPVFVFDLGKCNQLLSELLADNSKAESAEDMLSRL